jgi:tetratricopeptide (TPR) repeat protein
MRKPWTLDGNDPRRIYELDVLYEMNNQALEHRLQLFTSNPGVVRERNDSYLREIEVLLLNGKYDTAISRLTDHTFLRQEGVVRLHDYFVDAHLLKGRELLQLGRPARPWNTFSRQIPTPPTRISEAFPTISKEAQIYYFTGLAWLANQEEDKARSYFQKALEVPVGRSEYLYYRALAQKELGRDEEALESSASLLDLGEEALGKSRRNRLLRQIRRTCAKGPAPGGSPLPDGPGICCTGAA